MSLPRTLLALVAALAVMSACSPTPDGDDGSAQPSTPSTSASGSAPGSAPGSPTSGNEVTPPTEAAATPGKSDVQAAVADWLGARGITYAGPCSEASLPEDADSYCSAVSADRGTAVVLMLGQAFSEFDSWVLVKRGPNGWLVVQEADMPAPDDPEGSFEPPF